MSGKKILMIIAQVGFQDHEYLITRKELEKSGKAIDVAGITKEKAVGKFGMIVKPDLCIKKADLKDYQMVVLIGGPGAPALSEVIELKKLLDDAYGLGLIIGAICIAPTILAKAGILEGKKATVWHMDKEDQSIKIIETNGATFIDEDVVIDGNIVTANGPKAAERFGTQLRKLIG